MLQIFSKIPVADLRPETKREKSKFAASRRAEAQYARNLRGVAAQIGKLCEMFKDPSQSTKLEQVLERYSEMLRPWAKAAAERMLTDVSRRDETAWRAAGQEMGRALREEIRTAPTGEALRAMLAENVDLITSLPLDAARRVHHFVLEGMSGGIRADEVSREILKSGHVSKGRANLIARTEVARASSGLVETRALHVGSEGYIWRTAEDVDVRKEHKKLNGVFVRWDSPPVAGSNGERAHAGQIYNCRCYPEPVIPEEPS